jgi:hypothetical protein
MCCVNVQLAVWLTSGANEKAPCGALLESFVMFGYWHRDLLVSAGEVVFDPEVTVLPDPPVVDFSIVDLEEAALGDCLFESCFAEHFVPSVGCLLQ